MRDFQHKRKWRNMVESWPVLIFLFILLIFFAWGVIGLVGKMKVTKENRELAENKLAELEEKKLTFSADVKKLQTQEGIEESIRDRFPVVKEGEGLILVVEDKSVVEAKPEEQKGFFSFLFFWRD